MNHSLSLDLLTHIRSKTHCGRMILTLAGLVAMLFFSSITAVQAETLAWQKLEGGQIRILFDGEKLSGPASGFYGIIEVELKPEWKTYWSNPGNSGMAPEFLLEQSGTAEIFFPVPTLIQHDNDWAFGYYNKVQLPFHISNVAPDKTKISGKLLIGICNTLCIPVEVPFTFDLDKPSDIMTKGRINAVLSDLPSKATSDFKITAIENLDGAIRVMLKTPVKNETPQLFLNAGETQLGIPVVEKQNGDITLYKVPLQSGHLKTGQSIQYTASISGQAISDTISVP